jgi:hypothetical protein
MHGKDDLLHIDLDITVIEVDEEGKEGQIDVIFVK